MPLFFRTVGFCLHLGLLSSVPFAGAQTASAQANVKTDSSGGVDRPTQLGRTPIQTIPFTGNMNLDPPQPVVRPPAWADVEQRIEGQRRLRLEWGND